MSSFPLDATLARNGTSFLRLFAWVAGSFATTTCRKRHQINSDFSGFRLRRVEESFAFATEPRPQAKSSCESSQDLKDSARIKSKHVLASTVSRLPHDPSHLLHVQTFTKKKKKVKKKKKKKKP